MAARSAMILWSLAPHASYHHSTAGALDAHPVLTDEEYAKPIYTIPKTRILEYCSEKLKTRIARANPPPPELYHGMNHYI